MPLQYSGIINEHNWCRENASVFDISHLGQFKIHGKDRFDFIESLCVGDIKELKRGAARFSLITNRKGGIFDDIKVTNLKNHM